MQFGILLLMLLVAIVAVIRGLAFDLIGSLGAVLLAVLILSLIASHAPRGCVQKQTCKGELYEVQVAAA